MKQGRNNRRQLVKVDANGKITGATQIGDGHYVMATLKHDRPYPDMAQIYEAKPDGTLIGRWVNHLGLEINGKKHFQADKCCPLNNKEKESLIHALASGPKTGSRLELVFKKVEQELLEKDAGE